MPAEHLEQCRLARPLAPTIPTRSFGRDQPIEIFEEGFGRIVCRPRELDHC